LGMPNGKLEPSWVHVQGVWVAPSWLHQGCHQILSTQPGKGDPAPCNADTLLSRIRLTSHSSESFNSIGGGGSTTLLGISLVLVGCSSETWNTGWMRDRARDRPSQNACHDTLSTTGNGPRKRWSSFLKAVLFGCYKRPATQCHQPEIAGLGVDRELSGPCTV